MGKPIKHGNSWRISWHDAEGNRQSAVYGSYADAQFAINKARLEVFEIKRGLIRIDKTFDELADYYLKHRSSQKRKPADDKGIIGKHLRPHFGRYHISEVKNLLDDFNLKKSCLVSKKTHHNILSLLTSMLRVAEELNWLHSVPKIKKPKIKIFENDFCYLRSNYEIQAFLSSALLEENKVVHPMYAFAIFTGMREGEVAGLTWNDIDFKQRLIAVKRSFNGPTKNGESRYVPMTCSQVLIQT